MREDDQQVVREPDLALGAFERGVEWSSDRLAELPHLEEGVLYRTWIRDWLLLLMGRSVASGLTHVERTIGRCEGR